MPEGAIHDAETVARFAYEESYFRRGDGTIKPKAFYPDARGECSVTVVSGLDHSQIVAHADQHVTPHRNGKALMGYGSLACARIRSAGLEVIYAEPPPNHGNIVGYPPERERMISLAQELALHSVFQRI